MQILHPPLAQTRQSIVVRGLRSGRLVFRGRSLGRGASSRGGRGCGLFVLRRGSLEVVGGADVLAAADSAAG